MTSGVDSGPPRRRRPRRSASHLETYGWIAPASILAVAAGSPLLILLLPGNAGTGLLAAERRDKVVLGYWFALAAIFAFVALWRRARQEIPLDSSSGRPARRSAWAACAVAVVIVLVSIFWIADAAYAPSTPHLDVEQILLGSVAGGVLLPAATWWRRGGQLAFFASLGLSTALLVRFGLAIWQTPRSVVDTYHAPYAIDELLAPAAGRVPLSDYIPQYTNLLGLPIAPFVDADPGNAVHIALAWVSLLQAVTLVLVLVIAVVSSGWRYAPLSLLLFGGPVFALSANGKGTSTYFSSFPLRMVLPVLAFTLVIVCLRRSPLRTGRSILLVSVAAGIASGVAVLNNPDHGGAALVAVALTLLAWLRTWRERTLLLVGGAVGAIAPLACYQLCVTTLLGREVHWHYLLLFQRLFATQGFGAVPMPVFGAYVAVAALAVAATVSGVVVVRRAVSPRTRLQGAGLLMSGTWLLLTLAYYSGRSLDVPLAWGYGVQLALVAVTGAPLFVRAARSLLLRPDQHGPGATVTVALGFLVIAASAGGVFLGAGTRTSVERIATSERSPWEVTADQLRDDLEAPGAADVAAADRSGRVVEILDPSPSAVELLTGVPSASIVSAALYSTIPELTAMQCEHLRHEDFDFLIVNDWWATHWAVQSDRTCRSLLGGPTSHRELGGGIVAVPRR